MLLATHSYSARYRSFSAHEPAQVTLHAGDSFLQGPLPSFQFSNLGQFPFNVLICDIEGFWLWSSCRVKVILIIFIRLPHGFQLRCVCSNAVFQLSNRLGNGLVAVAQAGNLLFRTGNWAAPQLVKSRRQTLENDLLDIA